MCVKAASRFLTKLLLRELSLCLGVSGYRQLENSSVDFELVYFYTAFGSFS